MACLIRGRKGIPEKNAENVLTLGIGTKASLSLLSALLEKKMTTMYLHGIATVPVVRSVPSSSQHSHSVLRSVSERKKNDLNQHQVKKILGMHIQ